jgi:rubrerythrin
MKTLTTEEIIQRAITFEELSYNFYQRLKEVVLDAMTKDSLDFLAREELQHREFLENYLQGRLQGRLLGLKESHDARIAEAFDSPEPTPGLLQKDAFLIAAEKEKKSSEFYEKLAGLHPDGELRDILLKLAQEELAHKEKVEYLYVNAAFPQTSGG